MAESTDFAGRVPFAYKPADADSEPTALADATKAAAERAGHAIDDALDFVRASNARIAALEAKARKSDTRRKGA